MKKSLAMTVGLVVAALLLSFHCCLAQIPQKMNYQVMLTNDMDEPLANQGVALLFAIFDVVDGGLPLWAETQNVTTSSIGVVSVILGAVDPIDIDFDVPLWLEVRVDGEVLSPRREIVTAPYAGRAAESDNSDRLGDIEAHEYALLDDLDGPGTINDPSNPVDWNMLFNVPAGFADGADDTGGGDGHSLDADDGSPVDALYVDSEGNVGIGTTNPESKLQVDGDVRLQTPSPYATIWMKAGTSTDAGVVLFTNDSYGGELHVRNTDGVPYAAMGPMAYSGGGGYVFVSRDDLSNPGFMLYGNGNNNEEPRMEITGSTRSAVFDMDVSGTGGVQLPTSAIDYLEIGDEPAVASTQTNNHIDIANHPDVTNVVSRMIWCPHEGYVLAIATGGLVCQHDATFMSHSYIGVSDVYDAFSPRAQKSYYYVPAGDGGVYVFPYAVHGLFEVVAGTHSFYLVAQALGDEWNTRDNQFSLIYFPESYGIVDTNPTAAAPDGGIAELRARLEEVERRLGEPEDGAVSGPPKNIVLERRP